ncbi:glycosyltransferase family 4 protein [Thermogladius sp. KZ2Tp1]|uniref:glycosyltransferase family 4 protein n=1 Tax=Thermogladius sp. KZ2Tp1 TaxID=3136289 RepID=UPI003DA929A7
MLALVRHHMIGSILMGPGGSEYVSIETAISLKKAGFEVYIDSLGLRSADKLYSLCEFYGLNHDELRGVGLGYPQEDPDIVFNTSGDVLSGKSHVVYLHFPSFLEVNTYYPAVKGFAKTLGNLYSLLNNLIFPFYIKSTKVFLANSSLTAWFFNKVYGINPVVVYPPVNIDDIIGEEPLPFRDRERRILVISRFSPEKNLEKVVSIGRAVNERGIDMRITLAGAFSENNGWYLKKLVEEIEENGLSELIDLRLNISRSELVKLYKTSLVYVHLTPMEHFGITIVESMAAGTPTIIPRNSGAWFDIANEDTSISLPYTSVDELADHLVRLGRSEELWKRLSTNSRLRSLSFSRYRYHKEISRIIETVVGLWRST